MIPSTLGHFYGALRQPKAQGRRDVSAAIPQDRIKAAGGNDLHLDPVAAADPPIRQIAQPLHQAKGGFHRPTGSVAGNHRHDAQALRVKHIGQLTLPAVIDEDCDQPERMLTLPVAFIAPQLNDLIPHLRT